MDSPVPTYQWRPHFPGFVSRRETNLRINAWNTAAGVTLAITGLVQDDDGIVRSFQYAHIPNTNRTQTQQTYPLEDGTLLCLQVFALSGTPSGAQCFVRVELLQGVSGALQPLGTIVQDYVTANVALSYPGAPIDTPLVGPGLLRSIAGTDQAAGVDIIETVPANVRWRWISAVATLVTSAVVANRTVLLTFDDGANVFARGSATLAQTASLTQVYQLGGITLQGNTLGSVLYVPSPADIRLQAGYHIKTVTVGLDVGDNWGPPQYLVEEWLDV